MERPLPDTARKLYIRLTHRLFDVWHSYHLLVTCVYIRHFTIGKQPGLTVITYCRGSIPLIHAILFSRLHYQLRKLYWRHVKCSDTELVTPEENRHLIFDYQSFNAKIIWHLSSCIAIIRNKTMYFKQRCTIKRHTAMQYSKTWLWKVLGFFFIRNSLDIISAYNKFILSAYNEFVIEIITN